MKIQIGSVIVAGYSVMDAAQRKALAATLGISRHRLRGAISEHRARRTPPDVEIQVDQQTTNA